MGFKILWDETTKRFFESGIDRGVLFPMDVNGLYPTGVAWNGLISVTESPSGAEANPQYADNFKYLNLISAEDFGGSIEAFTYPAEFAVCDGTIVLATGLGISQQTRKMFGLSYRTLLGNDVSGLDLGYKIHLIYGAVATPSEKQRSTINESPEALTFNWDFTTTPVTFTGYKPTAHLIIDSTIAVPAKLAAFETVLYGATPSTAGRMPLPAEVVTLLT